MNPVLKDFLPSHKLLGNYFRKEEIESKIEAFDVSFSLFLSFSSLFISSPFQVFHAVTEDSIPGPVYKM